MTRNITPKTMSAEKDKASDKENNLEVWTPHERELSKSRYGCEIIQERCTLRDAKNPDLPLDAYLVSYLLDGKVCYDITRSPKQSKIFDLYWDKFREGFKGMRWADGKVNPKLWGYQAPKSKKRK